MSKYKLVYKSFGPRAILIAWPQKIDVAILKEILAFKKLVLDAELQDCIQAYCSLTLVYKHPIKNFNKEKRRLASLYKTLDYTSALTKTVWEIPVCYDSEYGPDLELISKATGFSKATIVEKHSSPSYQVYFLGFLPGFLYLGGLSPEIHSPRKETPRLRVSKGAVAIGGAQTGIYPQECPGGWNIIGKSPLTFFDIEKENPCFAKAGDRVKFKPISKRELKKIEKEIQQGIYELKTVSDD